jgi:hypothetical protein
MRKFSLLAATAALALTASCGAFAPQYPEFGRTAYRIEGTTAAPGGGASTHAVIYRDGPKMRIEAMLAHYGQAIVVFDQSTNAAYVLNPTAPVVAASAPGTVTGATAAARVPASATAAADAMASPAATVPSNTPAPASVTTAPRVSGVAVRLADADAPQPLETPWAALGANNAHSVGGCTVAGERGHEWRPKDAPAPGVERTACITADGIVLRVRENDRVLFQATSLQRGPQNASLFGVPPGYQLIDPEAVAEGVGAHMENLNSVTGAPTAPTPAPPRG